MEHDNRAARREPPLWGHYLAMDVLELGAGAGLPGLVVAKSGARTVVLTDYPDQVLVDNMRHNVVHNGVEVQVAVRGYIWGRPEPLQEPTGAKKFDLILLSDLIFHHAERRALLCTCEHAVAPRGGVLMFYTHHSPPLAERNMAFFDVARETGWACEKVLMERFAPMFPEDNGDEGVRATVHGWKLTRA